MEPVFLLPTLADVSGQSPELSAAASEADASWGTASPVTVDLLTIGLLLRQLAPVLFSLQLAGYQARRVYFGLQGDAPSDWVLVDLASQVVASVSVEEGDLLNSYWTGAASITFAAAFEVEPRWSDADGASLAMDIAQVGDGDWLLDFEAEVSGLLFLWGDAEIAKTGHLFKALDPAVLAFVDHALDALAERWEQSLAPTGAWPLAPEERAGLLWLFDPSYWSEDPTSDMSEGPSASSIAAAAETVMALVAADALSAVGATGGVIPRDFLEKQVYRNDRLIEVLRDSPSVKSARSSAKSFFDAVETLGGALDIGVRQVLPGLAWIEVLFHLIEANVLDPPALPSGSGLYAQAEEDIDVSFAAKVDPSAKEEAVEIRISGSEPVTLRVEHWLSGYDDLKSYFTWEYVNEEQGRALLVVAAPGVSISGGDNLPSDCPLQIFRLQSHALIPPWGTRIPTELYTGSREIETIGMGATEAPAFRIRERQNGVQIRYPVDVKDDGGSWFGWLGAALTEAATVETYVLVEIEILDPTSATTRFAWGVEPQFSPERGRDFHLLTVIRTPGVSVRVKHSAGIENYVVAYYGEVASIDEVPSPGEVSALSLPARVHALTNTSADFATELDWEEYFTIMTTTVDIGIGLIPVVGDIADLDELLSSFATGADRWGRPVTNVDRLVMFGGLMLPFVSSAALRGLKKAVRAATPALTETAAHFTKAVSHPADTAVTAAGKAFDADEAAALATRAERGIGATDAALIEDLAEGAGQSAGVIRPELEDLANDGMTALYHPELQEHFRRYVASGGTLPLTDWATTVLKIKPEIESLVRATGDGFTEVALDDLYQVYRRGGGAKNPVDWAKSQSNGRARGLFEILLGEDYVTRRNPRRAIRNKQNGPNWPSLQVIVRPATRDLAVLVDVIKDTSKLRTTLENVGVDSADSSVFAGWIQDVLAKVSSGGNLANLDEAAMGAFIGKKNHSPESLLESLALGLKLMDEEAVKVGAELDAVLGGATRNGKLLEVPGIEEYFKDLVRGSGYQHGATYEVYRLAKNLVEVGGDAKRLLMQVPMDDGLKGPDLAILHELGKRLILEQQKSYKNVWQLIAARESGELYRQILTDCTRLAEQGVKAIGPDGVTRLPVDRTIKIRVDWTRVENASMASFEVLEDQRAAMMEFQDFMNDMLSIKSNRISVEGVDYNPSTRPFQVEIDFD